ncbi:hypothetical protein AAA608_02190 [Pseudomonas aeruginosa]
MIAMVHDFTLVYALNPELDSQDEVLRRLAGWPAGRQRLCRRHSGLGRPGHIALAFSREARDRDVPVTLAVAQMAQVLAGAELVRVDAG